MTDFTVLLVADRGQAALPIHLVDKASFADWVKGRPAEDRALIQAHRFDGKSGFVLLPRGAEFEVVAAVKDSGALSPWCLAALAEKLPEGTYKLASAEIGGAAASRLAARPAPLRHLSRRQRRCRARPARVADQRPGRN